MVFSDLSPADRVELSTQNSVKGLATVCERASSLDSSIVCSSLNSHDLACFLAHRFSPPETFTAFLFQDLWFLDSTP